MKILKCKKCGKEFKVYGSDVYRRKHCSKECASLSMKTKVKRFCNQCGKSFEIWPSKLKLGWGKYCSAECRRSFIKESGMFVGENNPRWTGNFPTYDSLHYWLRNTFGKADKCENPECYGKSKTFQWSLLKGKRYERKRENFWQQCSSCHKKYDQLAPSHQQS